MDKQDVKKVHGQKVVKILPSTKKAPSFRPPLVTPPDANDADALAAHQLLQETMSASRNQKAQQRSRTKTSKPKQPPRSKSFKRKPKTKEKTPDLTPSKSRQSPHHHLSTPPVFFPTLPEPEPEGPFISFYSKPHLRDAALGKIRRGGRAVTAFGKPVPDVEEREFELPQDILTQEAIMSSRRKRRRLHRGEN